MPPLLAAAALLLLLWAAWRDLATRQIPDAAALMLAAGGAALRLSQGLPEAAATLATAAVLFAALVFLHAKNLLGGGDVKLIAALALGLPPVATLDLLAAIALCGGVLSLAYLALFRLRPATILPAGRGRPLLLRVLAAERWRLRRRGPLPYALAIAAGGALVLFAPAVVPPGG
jgi:prepilin peptidase CpaA